MNLILSAGYIDTKQNANLNIIIALAKTLNSMGNRCYVVGFLSDKSSKTGKINDIDFCGIQRNKWIDYFTKKTDDMHLDYEGLIANKAKLLKFAIQHPICMAFLCLRRFKYVEKAEIITYKNGLANIAKNQKIDAIISFCAPFHLAFASVDKNFKGRQIYYQLDPFGLNQLLDKMHIYDRIEQEISLINNVDAVITTKLLLDAYTKHETYKPYYKKMQWVDFPILVKNDLSAFDSTFNFNREDINLLFCGSVDDAYRNPEFLLSILKPILQKNKHIKVFFLGGCNSTILLQAVSDMPEQIFMHDVVPLQNAQKTMEEADILINIGNNISNMMPSKIFDYFAKGKPILNIEMLENCPANSYFERYPMQITFNAVNENNRLSNETNIKKLEEFILLTKCKNITFNEVEKLYQTATPKYVANKILELLKN